MYALDEVCQSLKNGLLASNTSRNYRYDWQLFRRFCVSMELDPLPGERLQELIARYPGSSASVSARQRLAASSKR